MLLPKQIWKDIEGYEGLYQVSNTGKVRSLNYRCTGKSKTLKQDTTKFGYNLIVLYKNHKRKVYLVHRLVAQAFIPNPNNLPEVNHIDENKANNQVSNLEWCDRTYNCNYGTYKQRVSEALKGKHEGKNNPRAKPVLMFTLDGDFIRKFDCVADANEYLGKDRRSKNIYICTRGKTKTAYGYIWKYE